MLNKRGLSQVVTTVLIILIVLAAVVLIWAAVRPLLNQATSNIEGADDCLVIDVEATSCTYTSAGVGSYTASVTVKRNAGDGDLKNVALLFTDSNQNSERSDQATLGIGESKTFTGISLTRQPAKVNVAAIVGSNNKVCTPLATPINCVLN